MKQLKVCIGLCSVLFALSSFECSKKNMEPMPADITASAHATDYPVLKGLLANPVLRVMVSVPSGNPDQHYSRLVCTINQEAISEVEKVDVYLTGAEPFSSNELLGSMQPSTSSLEIPVTLKIQPGLRFIWFSLVLKNSAPLKNKIEFHCSKLVGLTGREVRVKEDQSRFVKHVGSVVRKAGDDGVNTYRIPGILQTNLGNLIAVYDIRYNNSADLPGNIDVGMSRSLDSGRTWQPMKIIMDMGEPQNQNGIGDPSILFDPVTEKIWVAALWSKGNRSIAGSLPGLSPDTTGQFVLVSSQNDGLTWSTPVSITPQVKDPAWHLFFNGPGNGITMKDGKLVFSAQYWDENKMPYSTLIYSEDHGNTWKGKLKGPKSNTTESSIVETTPGSLMLNMRDNRGGFRSVATTKNFGQTWTEHSTSYNALPDPVCMASLIKVRVNVKGNMKDVLFFSNPATTSGRYNITVKASLDLGETWLPVNQVLVDARPCYGYSSLTKIDDHTIGILYEGTKDLYFVKLPVADIIK
jgi:sialidase-1